MACQVVPGAKCDVCGSEKPAFFVEKPQRDFLDIASQVMVVACVVILFCYVAVWVAHGCPVVPR